MNKALLNSIVFVSALLLSPAFVYAQPSEQPYLRLNLSGHSAPISQLEITPDRSRIVTASVDKTVKVWNSSSLRLEKTIRLPIAESFEGALYALAISPDGKTLAVSGFTGYTFEKSISVYLVDIDQETINSRISGLDEVVTNMRFSLDGTKLFVALSRNMGFRTIDVKRQAIISEDRNYGGNTIGIEHINDSWVATSSHDGRIRLYDSKGTLQDVITFDEESRPTAIRINQQKNILAVGFLGLPKVSVIYLNEGNRIADLSTDCFTNQSNTPRVFWNNDNLYSYGSYEGSGGAPLYKWTMKNGVFSNCERIQTTRRNFSDIDVLSDTQLAFATTDPSVGIFSLETNKEFVRGTPVADFRDSSNRFYVSSRADKVIFPAGKDGEQWEFNFFERTLTKANGLEKLQAEAGLTRNTRHNGNTENSPSLPTEKLVVNGITMPAEPYEIINDYVEYENGNVALATEFGVLLVANGAAVARHTTASHTEAITLSADQQTLVVLLADGTIKWFSAVSLEPYFTFFPNVLSVADEPQWVGWSEDGYYISSIYGDELIGWHLNNGIDKTADFYTALQYERILYRPDLVDNIFKTAGTQSAQEQQTDALELREISPGVLDIDIVESNENTATIKIVAEKRNLAHENIAVFVNNIPVLSKPQRFLSESESNEISRTMEVPLFSKENSIRVEISNGKSMALAEAQINAKSEVSTAQTGDLYIVSIGVNEFSAPGISDLNFAADDASIFLSALRAHGNNLYKKIHYREISDYSDTPPSKSNIESALEIVSDATPYDTVIIFVASHGISDAAGNYYFIPNDATQPDIDNLLDNGIAGESLLGWELFLQAMRNTAGKRLLIVDTCYARGISGPQDTHSLAKRSASASFGLLAASKGNEESQENPRLGHGIFTWALMQALEKGSDLNGDTFKSLADQWLMTSVSTNLNHRLLSLWHFPICKVWRLPINRKSVYAKVLHKLLSSNIKVS